MDANLGKPSTVDIDSFLGTARINDVIAVFVQGTDSAIWCKSGVKGIWAVDWASLGQPACGFRRSTGSNGVIVAGSAIWPFGCGNDSKVWCAMWSAPSWTLWMDLGDTHGYHVGSLIGATTKVDVSNGDGAHLYTSPLAVYVSDTASGRSVRLAWSPRNTWEWEDSDFDQQWSFPAKISMPLSDATVNFSLQAGEVHCTV